MAGPDIVDPTDTTDCKTANSVTWYPSEWLGNVQTKHPERAGTATAVFLTAAELNKWRTRYDTLVAGGCCTAKAWRLCLSNDPDGVAYRALG